MTTLGVALLVLLFALVSPLAGQDRPLEIIMEPELEFPDVIGHDESPPGAVTLVIGVSAAGEFMDALVTSYTHIEYAREATRAAALWTYRPALVGGKPVGAREEVVIRFEPERIVRQLAPMNTIDRMFEDTIPKEVVQVFVRARDLDVPLALVAAPPPPRVTLAEDLEVTVEFYIDQEGKTRLPAIRSMDHPVLARIVLKTIKEWRFSPPTYKGKPAVTRARQQFVFHGGEAGNAVEEPAATAAGS